MVAVKSISSRNRRILTFLLIWAFIIVFGFVYAVHSNMERAGVVVESQEVSPEVIPSDLQPYLKFQSNPIVLLLKQPFPVNVEIPQSERYIAAIVGQPVPVGTYVEIVDPIVDWNVDFRTYPILGGAYFDELMISDKLVTASPLEAGVELSLLSPGGILEWYTAFFSFYGGGLIFVLESLFIDKRPTFTSFLLAASGYSVQFFLLSDLASVHHNYLPPEQRLFGILFPALLIASLLVWRFERSTSGKRLRQTLWNLSEVGSTS